MTKHGGRYTKEYRIWLKMTERCRNPNVKEYALYGGRGIMVCGRWQRSFAAFLQDMGSRPRAGMSIDRIDGNKDYEPQNCRWATSTEQSKNLLRYETNTSGVTGVSWDSRRQRWVAQINRNGRRVALGRFVTKEDAIKVRCTAERELGFSPFHGAERITKTSHEAA